jgi:hypothetical protein
MVCAFWDDLNPGSGGQVRTATDASGTRFVVSWLNVPIYGTSNAQTFQLIFLSPTAYPTVNGNSAIIAQYQSVNNTGGCTVGHQNATLNAGLTYQNNGVMGANAVAIANSQSLMLSTGATTLAPVSGLQATVNGTNVVLNWTGNGAQSYRVYGGTSAWDDHNSLEITVSGTTATLPITTTAKWYDVRGVREYQAMGLLLERADWKPVDVEQVHPAWHK